MSVFYADCVHVVFVAVAPGTFNTRHIFFHNKFTLYLQIPEYLFSFTEKKIIVLSHWFKLFQFTTTTRLSLRKKTQDNIQTKT